MPKETIQGHFALLFFSMFVAGTYSLGHLAATYIDATALMALRFSLSAFLLMPIILIVLPKNQRHLKSIWRYLLLGSVFAVYFVTLFEALKVTTGISTSAIFTLTPFVTAGFAWLLLKQVTAPKILLIMLLAAVGAVWVIFKGSVDALLNLQVGEGEKIFLIGVVAHALYVPLARLWDRGEPVLVFTCGVLVGGSIPLLSLSYTTLLTINWNELPVIVWITLAYLVVFATLITFALLQYGNQRLPASQVMAYTYLVPSWVILWDLLLGRGMADRQVLPGVALSLLAMLLLVRRGGQQS